jgi:hypothetical protein
MQTIPRYRFQRPPRSCVMLWAVAQAVSIACATTLCATRAVAQQLTPSVSMVSIERLLYKPCLSVSSVQKAVRNWNATDWDTAPATANADENAREQYVTHGTYGMAALASASCALHYEEEHRPADAAWALYYEANATMLGVQSEPGPLYNYTTKQKINDLEQAWQTLHFAKGLCDPTACKAIYGLMEEVEHYQHTLEATQP